MLIHTDQKPYQCEQCDQSFRQKQLLKRHYNLYHNEEYIAPAPKEKTHQCPTCDKPFRHKGNLIRHLAIHDPESEMNQMNEALKAGRQKKIQIINENGEITDVKDEMEYEDEGTEPEDADEDEMEPQEQVVSIEGEDGQQFVVLEVMPMAGGDEQKVQPTKPATDAMMSGFFSEDLANRILGPLKGNKKDSKVDCFGFDEDDDDEEIIG